KKSRRVGRGQLIARSSINYPLAMNGREGVRKHNEATVRFMHKSVEEVINVCRSIYPCRHDLQAQRSSGGCTLVSISYPTRVIWILHERDASQRRSNLLKEL